MQVRSFGYSPHVTHGLTANASMSADLKPHTKQKSSLPLAVTQAQQEYCTNSKQKPHLAGTSPSSSHSSLAHDRAHATKAP
jgi:hypothetical protein